MPKVALRNYVRELESLIEKGQHDEAITHCRHILKFHPKHLEIYRLLGKAYLETKRYSEAEDIFNRILVAVPDDFVSHAGMSIVKDERGNLDEALWHMERAFETQPSNAAIQGELQRLYGRRDGVEPPRIRMTRGALAHMYIQGELYPQAISEIRAILAQDPQRADMLILLAEAFFRSGQKADASEVCSRLLVSLPYCFEANRIMVELLHGKDNIDKAQVYRQRVCELDPYAMYAPDSVFHSVEVPDNTIQVERLAAGGREVPIIKSTSAGEDQPEWLANGIGEIKNQTATSSEDRKQPEPDKNASLPPIESNIPSAIGISSKEENPLHPISSSAAGSIPDFLRDAGWKESSGEAGNGSGSQLFEMETTDEQETGTNGSSDDELMPVELPEWLKAKAPGDAKDQPFEAEPLPDWLDQLTSTGESDDKQDAQPSGATSVWLKGLVGEESELKQSQPFHTDQREISSPFIETPEEKSTEAGTTLNSSNKAQPINSLSDRMPAITLKGKPESEQNEAVGWLESLAGEHGAKDEELVTNPTESSANPPAWVSEVMHEVRDQPSELEMPETPLASDDETGVWLRDLDKKEPQSSGPGSAALETMPDSEESKPEWLNDLDKKFISEGSVGSGEADLPGWLQNLNPAASETRTDIFDDKEAGMSPAEGMLKAEKAQEPDSISKAVDFDTSVRTGGQEGDQPTLVPGEMEASQKDEMEMPSWLKGLDQKATTSDDQEDISTMPDWLKPMETKLGESASVDKENISQLPEMPALSDLQAEKSPIDVGAFEEKDLSDWLQSLDDVPPGIPATTAIDTMPRWMKGETDAPPKAEPTSPSDWRPIEEPNMPTPEVKSTVEAPQDDQPPESRPVHELNPIKSEVVTHELLQAQGSLNSGDLSGALDQYNHFIKTGALLDETIHDLRQAVYRYPIEVSLWQALGDAYMRANRLQEALDAFNKAEELLR